MPHVEIKGDKFDEIWEKLGTEFKSKFLMMPVAPYYIVVVSCPDYMNADELELELLMRDYVVQGVQAEVRGVDVANGRISR